MNDDINQSILSELQKFRKTGQLQTWILAVFVIAGIVFVAALRHDRNRAYQARPATQQPQPRPWDEVNAAMDRLDYQGALSLAQQLVAKQTNYYYGHAYLGNIYLALGDTTNAEKHYFRAFELWPDEENEKSLTAIRKRLAREVGGAPK